MFVIASLLVLSIFQGIIVNQVQGTYHNLDEERPEKFYVTHEAWFNISIRESKISPATIKTERIVIALFGDICPMTVTNFITITRGLKRGAVTSNCFSFFACLDSIKLFRRNIPTKIPPFIVLFVILLFKLVILRMEMELEVKRKLTNIKAMWNRFFLF